jgi:hypothetical protein
MRTFIVTALLLLASPAFAQGSSGKTPTSDEKAGTKKEAAAKAKRQCLKYYVTCKQKQSGKK